MLDPFSFNILISDIEEWLIKFRDNPSLEDIHLSGQCKYAKEAQIIYKFYDE